MVDPDRRLTGAQRTCARRARARAQRGMTTFEYLMLVAGVALGMLGVFRIFDTAVRDVSEHHARRITELTWPSGSAAVGTPPSAGSPLDPTDNGSSSGNGSTNGGDSGSANGDADGDGCSGFWGCTWAFVEGAASNWWEYETGVVGAAWDDVSGLVGDVKDFAVTLFTDPAALVTGAIDTAKYVIENPGEVALSLVWDEGSRAAWERGDHLEAIGRGAWNVVSWGIPGVNVAKVVAKGGKVVRAAREIASHVPDEKPCKGAACERPDGQCFAAGTLVHTEQGPRAIEQVAPGDRVWSRSETTGELALLPVTRRFVTHDQVVERLVFEAEDGALEALVVTLEHPFWSERGWVAASALEPGDGVTLLSGEEVVVRGAEVLSERSTVYNFEVDGFHTYFVGEQGLWVHNDCDEDGDGKRDGEGKDGEGKDGEDNENPPEGGYERDPDQPDPDSPEGQTTRVDEPAAGTPEHKALRWQQYLERRGEDPDRWSYEQWEKTYENNMVRATKARQAEEAYRERLGWPASQKTVTVDGHVRRVDVYHPGPPPRAREVKTGKQYATKENLWELERDKALRDLGWDVRWHFEGHVSQPLKDALDEAGIPYDIEP